MIRNRKRGPFTLLSLCISIRKSEPNKTSEFGLNANSNMKTQQLSFNGALNVLSLF